MHMAFQPSYCTELFEKYNEDGGKKPKVQYRNEKQISASKTQIMHLGFVLWALFRISNLLFEIWLRGDEGMR